MADVSIPGLATIAPVTGDSFPLMRAATGLLDRRGTVDALKTFAQAGLATVAASGAYGDLSGRPTLGTASAINLPGGTTTFMRGDGSFGAAGGGGFSSYTWATKPSASAVGAGTEIDITDVGTSRSRWYSDGTNWRPLNGRVTLRAQAGSVASPLATITASSGATFTLPGGNVIIPAGMLLPGARLGINVMAARTNNSVASYIAAWLGTSGIRANDSGIASSYFSSAGNISAIDARVAFSSSTSCTGNQSSNNWASGGFMQDFTRNIDTTAAMTLQIGADPANPADTCYLYNVQVWIEQ